MVYHVLILDVNGLPIIFRSYGEIEVDPTLISGFLSAQNTFIRELTGQEVERIFTKEYTFWMKKIGKFILTVVTDRNDREEYVKWRILQIQLAFVSNLDKEDLNFQIDVCALKSLEKTLSFAKPLNIGEVLYHVLLGDRIYIFSTDKHKLKVFISTILGVFPIRLRVFFPEENVSPANPQLVCSTERLDEIREVETYDVLYNLDEDKLVKRESRNNGIFAAFMLGKMFSTAASLGDIAGIETLRREMRTIINVLAKVKNEDNKTLNTDYIKNNFKIEEKIAFIILDILKNRLVKSANKFNF
ncbi:MAG: roadblock/LC7 domain-containing protein [Candidatus Odinarchaeia archaeon]